MKAIDIETALDWRGRAVIDRDGERIGTLKEIYLDADERPAWASVHTGLFGLRQSFMPLGEARRDGDEIRVPYRREHVRQAPSVDPDVQLSDVEEQRLHRHYGVSGDDERDVLGRAQTGRAPEASAPRPVEPAAADQSAPQSAEEPQPGPTHPARRGQAHAGDSSLADEPAEVGEETPQAMTRSEEQVAVGKRTVPRTRVRLRKYLVTDYVERTVPVQREEVRVEYEPPEGSRRGPAPPQDSGEEAGGEEG